MHRPWCLSIDSEIREVVRTVDASVLRVMDIVVPIPSAGHVEAATITPELPFILEM